MSKLKKTTRIKREKERLLDIYADLPEETLAIFQGQIDQASFLKIELEDLRDDLEKNGWVEPFQNSPNLPAYERDRPLAKQYMKLASEYRNTIKLLDDKLAKQNTQSPAQDDGFDSFASVFDESDS
jgi:hypothetical protein